ncbi:MAG: triose-phosphate isomerase [Nitrospiria bacterium]
MTAYPPCFVANWKMHFTLKETEDYLQAAGILLERQPECSSEIILAAPYTALSSVAAFLKASGAKISLAAQNVYFEEEGAYTGEISPRMLCEIGCRYVIIGHSERRRLFGETDGDVFRKIQAIGREGLLPILCIGESLEERLAGKTWTVLKDQLAKACGDNLPNDPLPGSMSNWIIAYEPIWAIGSGRTPNASETAIVHERIQGFIGKQYKKGRPRVLYGGSVSEKNIESFMKEAPIHGVLVGGASLSPESFFKIIELGEGAHKRHLVDCS